MRHATRIYRWMGTDTTMGFHGYAVAVHTPTGTILKGTVDEWDGDADLRAHTAFRWTETLRPVEGEDPPYWINYSDLQGVACFDNSESADHDFWLRTMFTL